MKRELAKSLAKKREERARKPGKGDKKKKK